MIPPDIQDLEFSFVINVRFLFEKTNNWCILSVLFVHRVGYDIRWETWCPLTVFSNVRFSWFVECRSSPLFSIFRLKKDLT